MQTPILGLKKEVTMEIRVQSLKFDADQKLLDFIEKKFSKLEKFHDSISDVELNLSLMEKPDNKSVKAIVRIPSDTLIVERQARTFEEAVNEVSDIMKDMLKKHKLKRQEV